MDSATYRSGELVSSDLTSHNYCQHTAHTLLDEAITSLERRIHDINSHSVDQQQLIESLRSQITDLQHRHGQDIVDNNIRYNELYEENQKLVREAEDAQIKLVETEITLIEAEEFKEHYCSRVEELFQSDLQCHIQLSNLEKKNADLEKQLQNLQAEHDSFVDRVGQAETMQDVENAMDNVLGVESSTPASEGYNGDDEQSEDELPSPILDRPLCESPEEIDSPDEFSALILATLQQRRMPRERVRPQASSEYSEDLEDDSTESTPFSSINGRSKLHLIIPENISEVEEVLIEAPHPQQSVHTPPTGSHPSPVLQLLPELEFTLFECISPAMLQRIPRVLVQQEVKYYKQLIVSGANSACTAGKDSIQHPITPQHGLDSSSAYQGELQHREVETESYYDCSSGCSTPNDAEEYPIFMSY